MMTTTMQHRGHAAGRTRRVASTSWHAVAPAFLGCGTTGVAVTPNERSVSEYSGNTTDTTKPAGTWANPMAIKRPARHLGTRST